MNIYSLEKSGKNRGGGGGNSEPEVSKKAQTTMAKTRP
jgi:hypothetical protein